MDGIEACGTTVLLVERAGKFRTNLDSWPGIVNGNVCMIFSYNNIRPSIHKSIDPFIYPSIHRLIDLLIHHYSFIHPSSHSFNSNNSFIYSFFLKRDALNKTYQLTRGCTWVNFCWVCAAGLLEPLPHYSLFCGQL